MFSKAIFSILTFLLIAFISFAQSPIGVWKTIDDETGAAKSHVEIYEKNGKLYGKIVKLLQRGPDVLCVSCPGEKKNQKVLGMEIVWDLQPYEDYWSYGKVLDPEAGKEYKCNVSMKGNNKLNLRGYIGFAALGRTQTWERIE